MLTKNWSEDRFKAYEELQIFLARRAAGDLEVQRCLQLNLTLDQLENFARIRLSLSPSAALHAIAICPP